VTVGPISQFLPLFPAGGSTRSNGSSKSSVTSTQGPTSDSTDPKDIIAEIANGGSAGLMKYQEKQIAKKAEENVLNSLGLTEADLKNLPPARKSAVEDAIAKAVKESLKNAMQGDGKAGSVPGSTAAAQTQAPAGPTTTSLVSNQTLSALFDFL
jgi:hypothetical protein